MKGIGIFVLVLLVAGGIAMYMFTRSPDRTLDPAGRAWVESFTTWRVRTTRQVIRAEVAIGPSTARLDPALVAPLADCASALDRLGNPPSLLDVVEEHARAACGEIAHALSLDRRYGGPALASVKQHLHRAEDWLAQTRIDLHDQLHPPPS